MTREAAFELIQAVLDGEATPGERSRLESMAAGSPPLLEEIQAARDLNAAIDAAGAGVPIPPIREEVMARIRTRTPRKPAEPVSFADGAARLRKRQWFVAAAAIAAAVSIVVFYPMLRTAVTQPASSLSGAMIPHGQASWREVARVATPSGNATATLQRQGQSVRLNVSLAREGTISVRWDAASLTPGEPLTPSSESSALCPGGSCPPIVFLSKGTPARVEVQLQGGETLTVAESPTGH